MSLEHAPERQRAISGLGTGQSKLWRYRDLKDARIVNSRMTLKRLIDSGRLASGRLISPNVRAWTDEEIDALITNAPTARKPGARKSAEGHIRSRASRRRDSAAAHEFPTKEVQP
jgi:hypothetical protein